eukprot:4149162-Pyramimonas_sp.AAC.1
MLQRSRSFARATCPCEPKAGSLQFLAMRARILLRGTALWREDGSVRALTNLQVLPKVRPAAPQVEMRVKRLRWLQACLREPPRCAQFLAVFSVALGAISAAKFRHT